MKNSVKIQKKKRNRKNNKNDSIKGFTLVELLGVIAVLSIILSIVIYFALNIINDSKDKSYQVTINNVQEVANNYVLEDMTLIPWIDEGSYQYQCITIQNLIDAGYFKGDVLESLVDDDVKLRASDYVYLERNTSTKTITKNILLVGKMSTYNGLCGSLNTSGDIRFLVKPSGWSKEKDITIYYRLYNYDSITNYKYDYNYLLSNGSVTKTLEDDFSNLSVSKSISVNENGTLYAKIKTLDGVEIVQEALSVFKIDNDDPTAVISSTNNVASSQTVTLSMSDSGSGIKSYYFGKTNPTTENVKWINVSADGSTTVATSESATVATGEAEPAVSAGVNNFSTTTKVDDSGTWYLAVKDIAGNATVVSKDFYKVNLVVNNGIVEPNFILVMKGNSFTIPDVTANIGYELKGWYTNNNYSGSAVTTYSPTGNSSLYAKMVIKLYTITLDNNGATTAGTEKIYEKYGLGVYLDSAYTKEMGTNSNKITIPTKMGYMFEGYYLNVSSTATSESNIQYINSSGYITSEFTNTTFGTDTTLEAKWIPVYVVTLDNNGATSAGTSTIYGKYGYGVYLDSVYTKEISTSSNKITIPTKTGYDFGGYYYNGIQMISANGYITSNFTKETFSSDVTWIAKWADTTPPTCTLSVTESGITFGTVYDNIGVVSQTLIGSVATSDSTISSSEKLSLSTGTKYGYVEDAAGNAGSCSVDIVYADDVYTCSKSAKNFSTVSCNRTYYSSPSSACSDGKKYDDDNCGRGSYYTVHRSTCFYDEARREYAWRVDNYYTEYNKTSCKTEILGNCSAQDQDGSALISDCERTGYYYTGKVTCYSLSCSTGTLNGENCELYNQSSCADDWTYGDTSKVCSNSGYKLVGNYCYK